MKRGIGILISSAFILLAAVALGTGSVFAVDTSGFKAGNIMSDMVFTDYGTMSVGQIQDFLNGKLVNCDPWGEKPSEHGGGTRRQWAEARNYKVPFTCLNNYKENGRSAAQIIYDVAQEYRINPQVLIVLLEKEQGLVTDGWPVEVQYRSATGYGCPDTAACDSDYYGFTNQLKNAAKMFRKIMDDDPNWYVVYELGNNFIHYNPDRDANGNYTCGGSNVYIENRATKALYNYTPYQPNAAALAAGWGTAHCGAYGNRNFYLYFREWFGDTQRTLKSDVYFPNGTYAIKAAAGTSFAAEDKGATVKHNVALGAYDKDKKNQKWELKKSGGFYSIRNVETGRYLDVQGESTQDGTNILTWESNGGKCNQLWAIVQGAARGQYSLFSACSGKAFDNVKDGTNIALWVSNKGAAQQFVFESFEKAPLADDVYTILPQAKPTYSLDVNGGGKQPNGTNVQVWQKNTQKFNLKRQLDGAYAITDVASGRNLDVTGNGVADGTNVVIHDKHSGCNQTWYYDGGVFISHCSGKALDINTGEVKNGQNVQLWSVNYGNAQKWKVEKWVEPPRLIADGTYVLLSGINDQFALDVNGGGKQPSGTNVQLWGRNNRDSQQFEIKHSKDGFYTIRNVGSGRYLDVAGRDMRDGANVAIWDGNGGCNQLWKPMVVDTTKITFVSQCEEGKALDAYGGNAYNGTNIGIWGRNTSGAQKWTLVKP